ncbi:MAG: hypothetical protein GXO25_00275 [Euryarchaeota archaeon]|nr:hypothetical protein [Euryarchaeota archaeon]
MNKRDRKLILELEAKKTEEKKNRKELVPLERGFYRSIAEAISNMRKEIMELYEKKQFLEAMRLTQEVEKIERSVQELLQFRLRKILIFAVWERKEIKNMTPEEIQLYTDIRSYISMFENRVFGREDAGVAPPGTAEHVTEPEKEINSESVKAEEDKPKTVESENEPVKDMHNENVVLVRVKSPVGRFALPGDVVLNLRKEDVLYLPEKVYRILARMDKVEMLHIEE